MSVVDKLHKLYSTSFEPVVWARSVGLEVINELDPIKAAIVLSAGGFSRSRREGPSLGEMAASGVVAATKGVDALCMLVKSVGGLARRRLEETIKKT
jgi:ubiquinone biosynthesis monooxygenase Coq6